jgi:hypothetical protein
MRSENNVERRINDALSSMVNEPQGEMMSESQPETMNESQGEMRGERYETRGEVMRDEPMTEGYAQNIHEVKIQALNSGFLVTVGCQRVAVETPDTLLKALKAYYENPSEFQINWFNNKNINKLQ